MNFFGLRLLPGFIAAVASLFFFGWLAEDVFEGETINFDQTIRGAIYRTATPVLTETMRIFSFLGSTVFLIALEICIAAAFYYLNRKRAFVLFVVTVLGETLLLTTLKASFRRARPEAFFDYALPASYSFPSGHSLFFVLLLRNSGVADYGADEKSNVENRRLDARRRSHSAYRHLARLSRRALSERCFGRLRGRSGLGRYGRIRRLLPRTTKVSRAIISSIKRLNIRCEVA